MKIDPKVYTTKFPEKCRTDLCRSRCCRFGVWADAGETEVILAHRHLFRHLMRPEASDPDAWFGKTLPDRDCPSGFSVETMDLGGACAFYHPDHGCVLQKGAEQAGLDGWFLKPRFCIMFPLVVTDGELTVDDDMKTIWCMKERNQTHPILESVQREVEYLFGRDTARTLLARTNGNGKGRPR